MASQIFAMVSSPQARAIDELLRGSFVICGVIFAIVAGLVGYCVIRFRARGDREPTQTEGNTRLEFGWTLVPAVVLVGLFAMTTRAVSGSDPPLTGDPDITVVAHQWWWEVKYKSGAITANEIHIPTGKALTIRVESADVVHDFWVPDLARKIDAIPGYPVSIQMQADAPGDYLGTCAEYCGAEHAWMRILVIAQAPDDYAAWERHEREPAPPPASEAAARGERVFRDRTCVRCHAVTGREDSSASGERVAPDLTHLGERKTLGAGVMNNTPGELARWLKEPQVVKNGSHMPDVRLTDDETRDLAAYFGELK